jgi:hypothetical protein
MPQQIDAHAIAALFENAGSYETIAAIVAGAAEH